jgi:alpha-tubulin suppressor-like RCC1 family protein
VVGDITFIDITAASNHTCGLTAAGLAYCWGSNAFGQLGSDGANRSTPQLVSGGLVFKSLAAGRYNYSDEIHNVGTSGHTCGVTTAALIYCWGDNLVGQLGVTTPAQSAVPLRVSWP